MKKQKNYLKEIYKANKQMVLYLFFGVCTTVINIVCYGIWNEILSLNNITSTILAWLVAVFFAFVTNKVYVFESQRTKTSERLSEMASFFFFWFITGVLDVVIMAITVDILKWNSLIWKLISNIIVTVVNYIASKFLIFKDTNK